MKVSADEWMFRLTLATAAATLISISASQILLTLTLAAWAILRPRGPRWPGYTVPMAAFMLATLLSLAMSPDPSVGAGPVRKFVLVSLGLLAATFVTTESRLRQTVKALVVVASVAALVGLIQFGFQYAEFRSTGDLADDPMVLARATGFMGHWMTFGGGQMLVWSAALPLLMALKFGAFRIGAGLIGVGLIFGFTRSVWIGAFAAVAVAAVYLPFRQIGRLLIPVVIVAILASGFIVRRVSMSFMEGNFAPDTGRIEMAGVGVRMVRDHPFFGVGPERVVSEFEAYYRGEDIQNLYIGHLHNNFLQIAAERGLICLIAFLWLFLRIGLDMVRGARSTDPVRKWASVAGLTVSMAFLSAGLFEYNFGDSEVLMLFLFLVSIPYGIMAREPLDHDGG